MYFCIYFGELESWIVNVLNKKTTTQYDLICDTPTCFIKNLMHFQPESVYVTICDKVDLKVSSLQKALYDVLVSKNSIVKVEQRKI